MELKGKTEALTTATTKSSLAMKVDEGGKAGWGKLAPPSPAPWCRPTGQVQPIRPRG